MDEPVRAKQVNVKLTDVEHAELGEAAQLAGQALATWARDVLLRAARGQAGAVTAEVKRADLDFLCTAVRTGLALQEETLRTMLEHVEHPSKDAEIAARRRADEAFRRKLARIDVTNGEARP